MKKKYALYFVVCLFAFGLCVDLFGKESANLNQKPKNFFAKIFLHFEDSDTLELEFDNPKSLYKFDFNNHSSESSCVANIDIQIVEGKKKERFQYHIRKKDISCDKLNEVIDEIRLGLKGI